MEAESFEIRAESEYGEFIGDPSEDAIFMMLEELNSDNNTFIIFEPTDETSSWHAVIALREEGEGFEVEFRDPDLLEHELFVEHDCGLVAQKVTQWMAQRPGGRDVHCD